MMFLAVLLISHHKCRYFLFIQKEVQNVKELDENKHHYYYKLRNYGVQTDKLTSQKVLKYYGKNDLSLDVFYVVPFSDDTVKSNNKRIESWLGIKFSKQTKENSLNKEEDERELNKFYEDCSKNIQTYDFLKHKEFEKVLDGYELTYFKKAIEIAQSNADENIMVLKPIEKTYSQLQKESILWIVFSAIVTTLIFILMLSFPKVKISV
ncbi:MAG: hypothetical protein NZ529_10145 [Cytophagaceae bacterium]|nr:hypothetical protein [Cytophagaceae bacterium]MDW8457145.1 hypothetical protein [Cytophagaceae bacterium]